MSASFRPSHHVRHAFIGDFVAFDAGDFCCADFAAFFAYNLERVPVVGFFGTADLFVNFADFIGMGDYFFNPFIVCSFQVKLACSYYFRIKMKLMKP